MRTAHPVRQLSADDLGVGRERALHEHASNRPDDPDLPADNPKLLEVIDLMDAYGGVIFTGPPGTSKTWYAAKIGTHLVEGDEDRIEFVQFHPSYQYEDFMQGFVPKRQGAGFELADKYFVDLCRRAARDSKRRLHILVIDELSRGESGRIFGEALTYVERSKRGLKFKLASGDECVVPDNFFVLATMNPLDRGVDEVDAAFERRFAKISMDPEPEVLRDALSRNTDDQGLVDSVMMFFVMLQSKAHETPQTAVGQTYFMNVKSVEDIRRVWHHQLKFHIAKAYRLDRDTASAIEQLYTRLFEPDDQSNTSNPIESTPTATVDDGLPDTASTATAAENQAPAAHEPTDVPGQQ